LKSTLLQLDSTFSEREYGASSFRDFMEKVAQAGAVSLKHAGRSLLVESLEEGGPPESVEAAPRGEQSARVEQATRVEPPPRDIDTDEEEEMPSSPLGNAEGVRAAQRAFVAGTPRWPMYIRQAKQFLKNSIEGFDERKYGFASVVDLLRAAAKVGVVRIERDRQGGMRVFPGANLKAAATHTVPETADMPDAVAEMPADVVEEPVTDVAADPPIMDAEYTEAALPLESAEGTAVDGEVVSAVEPAKRGRKRTSRQGSGSARKTKAAKEPKAAKNAKPRARRSTRGKSAEAADSGG
jgi:hypothetical protein